MCITTEKMLEALSLAGVHVPASVTSPNQIAMLYNQLQARNITDKSDKPAEPSGEDDSSPEPNDEIKEGAKPSTSKDMCMLTLQKEVEKMQLKIASLEAAVAKKFYVGHIETMVQSFSGDDFCTIQKWLADLENAFEVLDLTEKQKLIAANSLLTGTAAVFLRTIRVSEYEDLKTKLLNEFGSEFTVEEIHKHLRKRNLRPKETVRRYVLEMVEMAMSSCIAEDELVDIIIDGLGDTSNNVAMLYGARTIDELKQMLDRYERKRFGSSRRSVNASNDSKEPFFEIKLPSKSQEAIKDQLPTFGSPLGTEGNENKMSTSVFEKPLHKPNDVGFGSAPPFSFINPNSPFDRAINKVKRQP